MTLVLVQSVKNLVLIIYKPHMENKIADRLRQVRITLNKSQHQMAHALNIPQPTYWRWESGQVDIRVETIAELYLKFGVLPMYMCCGEGPMFKKDEPKKSLITDLKKIEAEQLAMRAKIDYLSRKK